MAESDDVTTTSGGGDGGSFRRQEGLVVEGQLVLEFAIIEEEDDRISIDGYDLHDLIASQFSDTRNTNRRQRLGKFRITVERIA